MAAVRGVSATMTSVNTSVASRTTGRHRPAPAPYSLDALRDRLAVTAFAAPRYAWVLPLIITVLGGVLRFWNLGHPNAIVFDETYYAKDAYSMLHFGYERNWVENADESFVAGAPAGLKDTAEYVVHPPVGKWMIAAGMAIFGDNNPFGWRFAAALIGTLSIALIAYAAWLLFRSAAVATLAALFTAVDGLHLVQSRLALLDIFLMFWLLATFVCLLLDRRSARERLARKIASNAATHGGRPTPEFMNYGPMLGLRWWRLAAGICAGLAVGVKWNGLFFIAAFGLLTVFWDATARRSVGVRKWLLAATVRDGVPAFCSLIVVGLGTYLLTWTGWFLSDHAYDRQWAANHPSEGVQWLPPALRSLWEYHRSAYAFHSGLDSPHTYQAAAWQWLILGRPTSYFYESPQQGEAGCRVSKCSEAVLNIGNPLLWWAFIVAIIFALVVLIVRSDWRFGALLGVFAVGYLPWFAYPHRTMFFFYALSFMPYLVLMLAGLFGLALGRPGDSPARKKWGLIVAGVFVIGLLLISIFFLPLWTAQTIPYEHWRWRMWFDAWI